MENNYWIPLGAALLGVAAALLGAWFSSKEQRRQWRDQLRLESYVELITSVRDVLFRGHDVGSRESGGDREEQLAALRRAMQAYRTTYNKVRLVGPSKIAKANEELHHYLSYELSTWFESLQTRHAEDAPEVIRARDLLEDLIGKAEEVLGIANGDTKLDATIRRMRQKRFR